MAKSLRVLKISSDDKLNMVTFYDPFLPVHFFIQISSCTNGEAHDNPKRLLKSDGGSLYLFRSVCSNVSAELFLLIRKIFIAWTSTTKTYFVDKFQLKRKARRHPIVKLICDRLIDWLIYWSVGRMLKQMWFTFKFSQSWYMFFRDLAAVLDRAKRLNFDDMLYVVDSAQMEHFQNVIQYASIFEELKHRYGQKEDTLKLFLHGLSSFSGFKN